MTFKDYRMKMDKAQGKALVFATCVENSREAFALVNAGTEAQIIARAAEKFALLNAA